MFLMFLMTFLLAGTAYDMKILKNAMRDEFNDKTLVLLHTHTP